MTCNRLSMVLKPIKSWDPTLINTKDMVSKSGKLFSAKGLIRLSDGKPILLPLAVRAMRKLKNIIHEEMEKVSAFEISLPVLVNESLLQATGRNEKEELFKLTDRNNKKYILSPTSEEAITDLFAREKLSEASLPLRLYQINTKFRDEMHPKHGLIRLKEFIMKDLYCFDSTPQSRNDTYSEILQQYHNFFQKLKLPFICARSNGSDMHSAQSHEFHFLSDIGEDEIIACKNCGANVNINMVGNREKCPICSSCNINISKGIEVGHTFNIGTVYSEKLKANFYDKAKTLKPLEMSSYGIGITRILGASVEVLSAGNRLRWPFLLSPYVVCIIPPKLKSKEEEQFGSLTNELYTDLNNHFKGDIVIDDRTEYTIGKRLILNQNLGFPFIVVIGNKMLNDTPRMEIFDVNADEKYLIHPSDVVTFISRKVSGRSFRVFTDYMGGCSSLCIAIFSQACARNKLIQQEIESKGNSKIGPARKVLPNAF